MAKFRVTINKTFEVEEEPESFKDDPEDKNEETPSGDDLLDYIRTSIYDSIRGHIDEDDFEITEVVEESK